MASDCLFTIEDMEKAYNGGFVKGFKEARDDDFKKSKLIGFYEWFEENFNGEDLI